MSNFSWRWITNIIPAAMGWEWGHTLDRSKVYYKDSTERGRQSHLPHLQPISFWAPPPKRKPVQAHGYHANSSWASGHVKELHGILVVIVWHGCKTTANVLDAARKKSLVHKLQKDRKTKHHDSTGKLLAKRNNSLTSSDWKKQTLKFKAGDIL